MTTKKEQAVAGKEIKKPVAPKKPVAAKATEPAKEVIEKAVVLVDGITCGKAENSVFAFTYRKKLITSPVFPLLPGNEHYGYNHHIDRGNFEKWATKFPALKSLEEMQKIEGFAGLTVGSWANVIRAEICKLIRDGKFNFVATNKQGKSVEVEIQWQGEAIESGELKFKKASEPKQKQAKADAELLQGLDLFN
jgi:hypothetical protein